MSSEGVNTDSQRLASMGSSVAIFLGGATVGAIAALLLAPQAGLESRRQLREYGRRIGETMRQWRTVASGVFATREDVQEPKEEVSGAHRERDEMVTPHSHVLAG